jgi:hypothetical protein
MALPIQIKLTLTVSTLKNNITSSLRDEEASYLINSSKTEGY